MDYLTSINDENKINYAVVMLRLGFKNEFFDVIQNFSKPDKILNSFIKDNKGYLVDEFNSIFQNNLRRGNLTYAFVNSMPRSGSTVLRQSLVSGMQNIWIFPELYTDEKIYHPDDFNILKLRSIMANLPSKSNNIHCVNPKEYKRAKNLRIAEKMQISYDQYLKKYNSAKSVPKENESSKLTLPVDFVIGDKRPYFFLNMDKTLENFKTKRVKLIHILRNEYDVVASAYKRFNDKNDTWYRDLDYVIDTYNQFLNCILQRIVSKSFEDHHDIYLSYDTMMDPGISLLVIKELSGTIDGLDLFNIFCGSANSSKIRDEKKTMKKDPNLLKILHEKIDYPVKKKIMDLTGISF